MAISAPACDFVGDIQPCRRKADPVTSAPAEAQDVGTRHMVLWRSASLENRYTGRFPARNPGASLVLNFHIMQMP